VLGLRIPLRSLVALVVVAGVVIAVLATRGGSGPAAAQQSPAPLATYSERAPHVFSQLDEYGVQGAVRAESSTPPSLLPPVSAQAFAAPVAAYRRYALRQLGLMEGSIGRLEAALGDGDLTGAQQAWREAFTYYLELGAVYLEGPIATLNQAIDGNAGGLVGGTSSAHFSGLHRLELGLWTGQPLASLAPWARALMRDVRELRRVLPGVPISPLDYATRAHEILEDAVRDLFSGTDVPWSGEGVLGTAAGITATREVIATLRTLLTAREGVLEVVNQQLATLQRAMSSIQAAHGGRLPTNAELTQPQSELLDSAIGGALEALAQVPGALETAPTPSIPPIPASAVRIDP
jgi:iron uptake system EfeUOB component EfeO/EfeM